MGSEMCIRDSIALDAAVDLSIKSEEAWRPRSSDNMEAEDGEDSDDDAPLDMSVTSRLTPVFPGFQRDHSPASVRSGSPLFYRLPGMYSPGPGSQGTRDVSADRSEADKGNDGRLECHEWHMVTWLVSDDFPRDGCQFCGVSGPGFSPAEHGEGVCKLLQPLSCPLCSKTFTIWSHYEAHKKCHQKLKQRQYPCQTCGKVMFYWCTSNTEFKYRS